MIYDRAVLYTKKLKDYQPYPKASCRHKWEQLDGDLKQYTLDIANKYRGYDYPRLTAAMFMRFGEDGNREVYEKQYFHIRYAINALVLAECIENQGTYIKDIVNGIFAICEETAWHFPAHNTYKRDAKGSLLADYDRPVLALFSCETGALLATIDYVLGEQLDAVCPLIRKRIKSELRRRIIEPYLSEHFWWMGRGDEPMNNWTVWCTQNVLLTFFLVEWPEAKRQEAFQKAAKSMDYFLKEYGDDGCCDEGAIYYRKSGLCFFTAVECINGITGGHFLDVYKETKIYNIAEYIFHVHIHGSYYVNFADCSAVPGPSGIKEYLFGKRTHNQQLMNYAAVDYQEANDRMLEEESNLFYNLQKLFEHDEVMGYKTHPVQPVSEKYYESVGLWIRRKDAYYLAVKAGDNGDSHNHNDTGSYILFKDNQPVIVDIGVETYQAKTFSQDRYSIWTMQSDYHNLPTINGQMQLPGEKHRAKNVTINRNENSDYIKMNLTEVYPIEANCKSFMRTIALFNSGYVQIRDKIQADSEEQHKWITNMIVYNKPRIMGNCLYINKDVKIEFIGAIEPIEVEVLPITDERLMQSWDQDLYRVRVHCNSDELVTRIY